MGGTHTLPSGLGSSTEAVPVLFKEERTGPPTSALHPLLCTCPLPYARTPSRGHASLLRAHTHPKGNIKCHCNIR